MRRTPHNSATPNTSTPDPSSNNASNSSLHSTGHTTPDEYHPPLVLSNEPDFAGFWGTQSPAPEYTQVIASREDVSTSWELRTFPTPNLEQGFTSIKPLDISFSGSHDSLHLSGIFSDVSVPLDWEGLYRMAIEEEFTENLQDKNHSCPDGYSGNIALQQTQLHEHHDFFIPQDEFGQSKHLPIYGEPSPPILTCR